jgi:thiamine kinase-like enzyme
VHALLHYFERVGFEGAPRVLGLYEEGREILTFVEGRVPGTDWTPTDDETVFAVGKLFRAMHDAQAGFVPPAGAQWQMPSGLPGDDVICHNDALGSNVVFRDGRPVALIDWELAAPGLRITDVAAAAAWWVPLRSDDGAKHFGLPTDRRHERLRRLADGYGLEARERRELLDNCIRVFEGWYDIHSGVSGQRWLKGRWDANLIAPAIRKNIDWLEAHRAELDSWLD